MCIPISLDMYSGINIDLCIKEHQSSLKLVRTFMVFVCLFNI